MIRSCLMVHLSRMWLRARSSSDDGWCLVRCRRDRRLRRQRGKSDPPDAAVRIVLASKVSGTLKINR